MTSPVSLPSQVVSNWLLESEQKFDPISSTAKRLENDYIFDAQNAPMQYLLYERILPPLIIEGLLDLVDGRITSETRKAISRFLESFQMPCNLREKIKIMIEDLKEVVISHPDFPKNLFQQVSLAILLELDKFIKRKIDEKKSTALYNKLLDYAVTGKDLRNIRLDPDPQRAGVRLDHWLAQWGPLTVVERRATSSNLQPVFLEKGADPMHQKQEIAKGLKKVETDSEVTPSSLSSLQGMHSRYLD